jgi:mannose-6-phosphate isomerase-like protein (cupin superfamily)
MTTPRGAADEEVTVGRERITFLLTSDRTAGDVAVLGVTIPPGGGPPLLHRHDPSEVYCVRRGELAVYREGADGAVARSVAGAGTAVSIAGGVEHTVRNESDDEVEAVVVFCPGEPMERFARAAGELGHDATPADMLRLAEASGIEMTRSIPDAPAFLSP